VLPHLCQILTKSSLESKKKDKGSSYRFTQLFKLQKELLSNMGDLAMHLNLQERETDQLLAAAAPYLSNLQPLPLQVHPQWNKFCYGFQKRAGVAQSV
jgi:hypothetical protein